MHPGLPPKSRRMRPLLTAIAVVVALCTVLVPAASARTNTRLRMLDANNIVAGPCALNSRRTSSAAVRSARRVRVSGACHGMRRRTRRVALRSRAKARRRALGRNTVAPISEPAEEPAGEAANEPGEPTEITAEGAEGSEADEPVRESADEGSEELSGEAVGEQRKNEGELPGESGETLTDPFDQRFLTYVPFGTISFWLQPWRSYLDTWPASRLLNAVGINFAATGTQTSAISQLLQDSGFKLARKGIPWDTFTYANPTQFRNEPRIRASLASLRQHGMRPLIVLDANSTAPTPLRHTPLETIAPVAAGAQTVKLSPASAAQVVPGKTGFNNLTFGGSPDVLITAVAANGVATLSRPLLSPLGAGMHGGTTLRYAPFAAPTLANGQPNPAFRETMNGWLAYVGAICREASSAVGPGNFDLEVWNELTFGSQFLNLEHYEAHSPATKAHMVEVNKQIRKALLAETVAYVRNPANGISSAVGITDGFASQSPFSSGANAPLGLTALSKHPYIGAKVFPAEFPQHRNTPIDALGNRDAPVHTFTPAFVPTYQSLLPEYTIGGSWTESLIRDIAPFTTYVYGYPHGRFVHPPGGEPVQKWITEFNMTTGRGVPYDAEGTAPAAGVTLSSADKAHFQAKALLRDLVSMVGKGFSRDYFFHASPRLGGGMNLVSPGFISALEQHPGVYPGDAAGGETLTGFRNMLSRFQGPGPTGAARQLKLLSISQEGNHAQFTGDGTAAHPTQYDRDVLAVLPFQSSPTRFVIPVYVMTRDLLTLYRPEAPASDVTRYDLPPENFRITLSNLPQTANPPTVSAYDPLHNTSTPARMLSREGETGVFEIAATDYPRVLTIDFGS